MILKEFLENGENIERFNIITAASEIMLGLGQLAIKAEDDVLNSLSSIGLFSDEYKIILQISSCYENNIKGRAKNFFFTSLNNFWERLVYIVRKWNRRQPLLLKQKRNIWYGNSQSWEERTKSLSGPVPRDRSHPIQRMVAFIVLFINPSSAIWGSYLSVQFLTWLGDENCLIACWFGAALYR